MPRGTSVAVQLAEEHGYVTRQMLREALGGLSWSHTTRILRSATVAGLLVRSRLKIYDPTDNQLRVYWTLPGAAPEDAAHWPLRM